MERGEVCSGSHEKIQGLKGELGHRIKAQALIGTKRDIFKKIQGDIWNALRDGFLQSCMAFRHLRP
jgi:hypothetical protein